MTDASRVDVWLFHVRVYRTRSQASAACRAGHVKVNGASVKPAHVVRVGDEVRATLAHERILGVDALPNHRGGADEAATAFTDRTPPPPPRAETPDRVLRDLAAGRPTKKDRRDITRLRGY